MNYRLLFAFLFIVAIVIIYSLGLLDFISIEAIKCQQLLLEDFVNRHIVWASAIYILLHTAAITFFLPFGSILNIIAGFLFGIFVGGTLALIAGSIGSLLAFFTARYFLKDWIQQRFAKNVRFFNHEIEHYGVYYLVGIHFIMGIPIALINILAGLSHVSWQQFLWTTVIGSLPGMYIHAYIGYLFHSVNSLADIVSTRIISALVILGLVIFVSLILRRYKQFRIQQ